MPADSGSVTALSLQPDDGQTFFAGTSSGEVIAFDVCKGIALARYARSTAPVTALTALPR